MDSPHLPALQVIYSPGIDATEWEGRYAAGTVPSRWPYGLDTLGDHGYTVANDFTPGDFHAAVTLGFDERVAAAVARSSGVRVCGTIWLADELLKPKGPRMWLRLRRTLRSIRDLDVILTYSRSNAALLPTLIGVNADKVRFVKLGIDTDFYQPQGPSEGLTVLSVGNDRARDIGTLYTALRMVHDELPDVLFRVQTNNTLPAPSFVERVTRFKDHRELREQYSRASLVVVASRPNHYCSGSTVALEAQSMGRPVVISNTPGMEDYVIDGRTGSLSPPGDAAAMAQRMVWLLRDSSLRESIGTSGAAHVAKSHTIDAMVSAIAGAIESGQ